MCQYIVQTSTDLLNLLVLFITSTVMEIHAESTTTVTAVSATSHLDQSAALAAKAPSVLTKLTVHLATTALEERATTGGKPMPVLTINA